jgi:2-oxoglutarate dehydrogenase E2 component (dihydrolipoamide succinyltransferase)
MPIELKVPEMGESVTQVQVGDWFSPQATGWRRDAAVVVLESDKATFELPAPVSGTLTRVLKQKGDTAEVGEVIGYLEPSEQPAGGKASKDAKPAPAKDTKSAPATKDAKPVPGPRTPGHRPHRPARTAARPA